MIEILLAEKGGAVLRQGGRLLASRFDPVAEAEAWLSQRRAFLNKAKGVFVLGLGSGYHVATLLKHTQAKIVVIERHAEIIAAVKQIHDFKDPRVSIHRLETVRSLRANAAVKNLILQSFVVLTHPASFAQAPEFLREARAQLLGREWGALSWQWKLKGLPDLENTPKLAVGPALTIYDLEQTELVQDSDERERLLIKALRELVK